MKYKRLYDEGSDVERSLVLKMFIALGVIAFLVIATLVGSLFRLAAIEKHWSIIHGLTGFGLILTILIFGFLCFVAWRVATTFDKRNVVEQVTEDGTMIVKNKVGGTTRWIEWNEIKRDFFVGKPDDAPDVILGFPEKSEGNSSDVIGLKEMPLDSNHNDLVVANMGRGKTVTYVVVTLIQAVMHGHSFIVNDPKSELIQYLGYFCKKMGYNTHILNLNELDHSEFWNVIEETVEPETERLDSHRLNIFVDTFMANTGDGKKDFWYNSALNLVKAVIGLVSWQHEVVIRDNYKKLYQKITNCSDNDPMITLFSDNPRPISFVFAKEKIREEAKKRNYDMDELENILQEIAKGSNEFKYTIGAVFDKIMDFETIELEEWEEIPSWHPAFTAYKTYSSNETPTVRQSAIQGTKIRFQLFSDYKLKEILSHDGIKMGDINKKKSAYFVVTSDKTKTLLPIASLFFSFFYKDVMDSFDSINQSCKDKGMPNPCLPVICMLEEFYSLGVITGDSDLYGKYMATSRSRLIHNKIVIQYYTQLEELYGRNLKDGIEGACETIVFLGTADETTAKWLSARIGSTTVLTESHTENTSTFSQAASRQSNIGATNRPLIYPEDLTRYPKFHGIVLHADKLPMKVKTFYYQKHPAYQQGLMKEVSAKTLVPLLNERLDIIDEKEAEYFKTDQEISKMIFNLINNVDVETGEILGHNTIVPTRSSDVTPNTISNKSTLSLNDMFDQDEKNSVLNIFDNPTSQVKDSIDIFEDEPITNPSKVDSILEVVEVQKSKNILEEELTELSKPITEIEDSKKSIKEGNDFKAKDNIDILTLNSSEQTSDLPKGRPSMKKKKKSLLEE